MKHASEALVFMILLVTPLLLSGVISPVISEAEIQVQNPMKISTPSYEDHDPIWIYNDTAFDDMASAEGWIGDGSPGDPYVIEGYNITTDEVAIDIYDVTVSFEIRDCYIVNETIGMASPGIVIENSTLVSISDTIFEYRMIGIVLSYQHSGIITGCTISHASDNHILVNDSEGLSIESCNLDICDNTGIVISYTNNTMINNCEISNAEYSGIYLGHSNDITVTNSEVYDCSNHGINVYYSSHVTIENNVIHDNMWGGIPLCGVYLTYSDHASIIGNEIYDNARNGIYLEYSDWAYIFDNDIYGNSDHGIDAILSYNGTILQNRIFENGWWPVLINALCGIYLGNSADWLIADNLIWNNTPSGISLEIAQRIEIHNNEIFNNTDAGIDSRNGEELYIHQNRVYGNGYYGPSWWSQGGIILDSSFSCVIEDNEVYNNTYNGIIFYGDNNIVTNNYIYDNNLGGIFTEECYNNILSSNLVHSNEYGIYVVNIGTNVTDNIVYDNDFGIFMEWSGDCFIYGNDVGWNDVNAFETATFAGQPLYWHDNVSIGNWWHNYNYTGYYNISSDTGDDNVDLYPARSLELVSPSPINYEILETGNTLLWDAYALHPDHYEVYIDSVGTYIGPWDGGDIEVNVDGLADGLHTIEVVVFHISGHSIGNTSIVEVEDLTPPSLDGPSHIAITVGESVSEQYTAFDPSGIEEWSVNDTVNFAISSTGLLTNITALPVGDYEIRIEVSDVFGHIAYHDVLVTIIASTTTTTTTSTTTGTSTTSTNTTTTGTGGTPINANLLTIIAGASAVVVILLVVIVIVSKRRSS